MARLVTAMLQPGIAMGTHYVALSAVFSNVTFFIPNVVGLTPSISAARQPDCLSPYMPSNGQRHQANVVRLTTTSGRLQAAGVRRSSTIVMT
jgi:hypothetical protein